MNIYILCIIFIYSIHSNYISSACAVIIWSCHNQSIQELRSCMKRQGFGLMVSKYIMLRMFGLLSLLRSKVTIWFQNSDSTRFHSISSLSMLSFVLITDLWMYFLTFPPYVSLFSFFGFQYVSQKSSPLTNLMASLRSWPQHKTSEGHRLQVACVVLRIYGLTSLLAGSSRRGWFKSVKEIQGTLLDPIGKIWPHIFHHTSTFVSRIFADIPHGNWNTLPKKNDLAAAGFWKPWRSSPSTRSPARWKTWLLLPKR